MNFLYYFKNVNPPFQHFGPFYQNPNRLWSYMCFQYFPNIGNLATMNIKFAWWFFDTRMRQYPIYRDFHELVLKFSLLGWRQILSFCCYFVFIVLAHVGNLSRRLNTQNTGAFHILFFFNQTYEDVSRPFLQGVRKNRYLKNCYFQQSIKHVKFLPAAAHNRTKIKIISNVHNIFPDRGRIKDSHVTYMLHWP